MSNLHSKYGALTVHGTEVSDRSFRHAKFMLEGFPGANPYELESIIISSITLAFAERRLTHAMKMRKEERKHEK